RGSRSSVRSVSSPRSRRSSASLFTTRGTARKFRRAASTSEEEIMSTVVEAPIVVARTRDNVVIGDEGVRHRFATRLIHWTVALTFFIALFSGMPIWTPLFGWMAYFVGGLEAARVIHPYAGIAFFIASLFQFFHWLPDMHFEKDEKGWFGPKLISPFKGNQARATG